MYGQVKLSYIKAWKKITDIFLDRIEIKDCK